MRLEISQLIYNKFVDKKFVPSNLDATADVEWIQNHSGLPWMELDIEVPYKVMLEELVHVESYLVAHREQYGESHGWKSFCLHGKSYDATREDNYYNDNREHTWTKQAQELMPFTVNYFQSQWPKTHFQRLRLMLLQPGGYITLHKDHSTNKLGPVNIALSNPDQCHFVFEKHGAVPFQPGRAFWLDVGNHHVVFNHSDQPRWHIIIHQKAHSPEFEELIARSYKILYNKVNENSNYHHT
jgi:hypothetical protein